MPKPRINGSRSPIRQRIRASYDPNRGQTIEIPFESAGNGLIGLALAFQQQRIAYDLEPNACRSKLIAKASGGQLGIPDLTCDTWQILANEIQKDLLEHPLFAGVSADDLRLIKKFVNGDQEQSPALTSPAAIALYDLLLRGTTHYSLGQYVLRHTTNVSNAPAFNVSDFNVERIYTFSQLFAEVTNSASWIFPMPGRLVAKLSALAAPIERPDYLWGWRKLPSTETTASGNRIEITTEYWLEQWSMVIYGTFT